MSNCLINIQVAGLFTLVPIHAAQRMAWEKNVLLSLSLLIKFGIAANKVNHLHAPTNKEMLHDQL